jgi:signal transduction histidine kinase
MVVLLRWVLIIATSYLVLFSRDLQATPPIVGLFIAVYLASNLLLSTYFVKLRGHRWFDIGVVLFDILAVGIGLSLTESGSTDFFPVFFLVIFIGALTERMLLVVGAAALIGIVHLSTLSRFLDAGTLLDSEHFLRIPFLFVVALFFGFEAKLVRSRERNDRARERKRLTSESLSVVTHDLKNPLGVIQSLANLLLEGDAGPLSDDQAGLVRRIQVNVQRLLQLSSNLLDVARIEAGRLELHRASTNLRDVVENVLGLARSAADIKKVVLQLAVEPGLPLADVDGLQIERVAANLLDNAIKYTPAGGTVKVSLRGFADEFILEVRDTGTGIAAEELASLFQKYQRSSESSRIQGSGLGLYIVKAIVAAHGGTVDVASELGKGTTVTVRLAAAHAAEPVSVIESDEQPAWSGLPITASAK